MTMVHLPSSKSASSIPSPSSSKLSTTTTHDNYTNNNNDSMNETRRSIHHRWRQRQRRRHNQHIVTNTALTLTACTIITFLVMLLVVVTTTTFFSVEQSKTIQTKHPHSRGSSYSTRNVANINHGRALEGEYGNGNNNDDNNNSGYNDIDNNGAANITNGDYSAYRCDEIYTNTPFYSSTTTTISSDSTTTNNKRCQYAQTCDNNSGLLFPFIFCHTPSFLSPMQFMMLLSPVILLLLTLLFRLLGSTADEYFSPALEMFSSELGLPPRFAGVTLLALGNGASDVSATMNAVWSDPTNGYKLSLGALTGASMFVTTIVAGMVILANGGVVCRGALLRDVAALGVTVMVVALSLLGGEIGPGVSSIFLEGSIPFIARGCRVFVSLN